LGLGDCGDRRKVVRIRQCDAEVAGEDFAQFGSVAQNAPGAGAVEGADRHPLVEQSIAPPRIRPRGHQVVHEQPLRVGRGVPICDLVIHGQLLL